MRLVAWTIPAAVNWCSDFKIWLHGPKCQPYPRVDRDASDTELKKAGLYSTPGCQIGHADHTGCHRMAL